MTVIAYIVIAEAFLLIMLAAVLMLSSKAADTDKLISGRFSMLSMEVEARKSGSGWWGPVLKRIEDGFVRAGIRHDGKAWWLVLLLAIIIIGVLALLYGIGAGFMALCGGVLAVYGFLQFRYRQRAEALLGQLPRFIDNLERSLGAGRSLLSALEQATERTSGPLQNVLLRVKNNVELGGSLGEQLQHAANTMAVREFQLLALAVNVHQRYGGSIKGLLHSITIMVRQHEQAQREFAALTGETRFSAWVLGVLPLLVAGYMVMVNPGYIESMWMDEAGRNMLYLALGFQMAGGFVLWRMIKSI